MNIRNAGIILALLTSLLIGVTQAQENNTPPPANKPIPNKTLQSGIDLTAIDRATRPQDDFYQFTNGTWLSNAAIQATSSGYTIYNEVYDEAEKALRNIIETAAKNTNPTGSEAQKIGDLYNSW